MDSHPDAVVRGGRSGSGGKSSGSSKENEESEEVWLGFSGSAGTSSDGSGGRWSIFGGGGESDVKDEMIGGRGGGGQPGTWTEVSGNVGEREGGGTVLGTIEDGEEVEPREWHGFNWSMETM